jgi:ribosomal protein L19
MNLIDYVHEQVTLKRDLPSFRPGDNIAVNYKIIEGTKERIQVFRGDVIQINGDGATKNIYCQKNIKWRRCRKNIPFRFTGNSRYRSIEKRKSQKS